MPEPAAKRRWNGFVCPECRFIFRVERDHEGRGVVCPSCRRLLRLPADGDVVPPLVLPGTAAPAGGPADAASHHRHHRHRFDETFADKEEASPVLIKALIGGVTLLGLVVAGVLLWPTKPAEPPAAVQSVLAPAEAPVAGEQEMPDGHGEVSPRFVHRELKPVFREFLLSEDLDRMEMKVRHPRVTRRRMDAYYGGDYQPPGFSQVVANVLPTQTGPFVTVLVEDGNFNQRAMSVAKEGELWKVDWESWVGWAPMDLPTFRERKPVEPVRFRVWVRPVNYYNFNFRDELAYRSFLIESPEQDAAVYGYAPRHGELDDRLSASDEPGGRAMLLELRFPEDAASDNQVLVERVVAEGWLDPEDGS